MKKVTRNPVSQGVPRLLDQLFWSIRGIHSLQEGIRGTWADNIGISTPQLMLILALRDFDPKKSGLPVKEVARILGVDPAFVTTQSKLLEAKGLLRRVPSREDARVVHLSLSDKSVKQLTDLAVRETKVNDYVFSEYSEQGIQALVSKVISLQNRMERASALASINLED